MIWIKYLVPKSKISLVLLLIGCVPLIAQKPIVIIDAGHGGYDSGAIGWGGIKEKDLVLLITQEVNRLNEALYDNQIEIYNTRTSDKFISLRNRGRLAVALDADLFISIHCNNMNGNTSSKGTEVFIINPLSKYNQSNIKKSLDFGVYLNNAFTDKLKIKQRGVKFENFQVLRETIDFCPSVLLETAFISNQQEAEHFKSKENITAMALAIIDSIYLYLEINI